MKPYTGALDSNGVIHPDLTLIQLENKKGTDDVASGIFEGKELVIDAGGSQPSWIVCLDDLTRAYRMPPSEKEEQDLIHLAKSSGAKLVTLEAPFGSYRLPNRLLVVKAMEDNGITLYFLDSKYSTRAYRNAGYKGPRKKSTDKTGWTNPEAAIAQAEFFIKKMEQASTGKGCVLSSVTVAKFTRDHTERNARRQDAQRKLKDLRRDGGQEYNGHHDRMDVLLGKFRNAQYEKIAFSSEVALATLYTIAEYSPTQNDIDDFFPREGSYRKPHADQAGIFRSNIAIHMKQHSLKELRQTARAIRAILVDLSLQA